MEQVAKDHQEVKDKEDLLGLLDHLVLLEEEVIVVPQDDKDLLEVLDHLLELDLQEQQDQQEDVDLLGL